MSREELDAVTRVAIQRSMARVDDVLTEFRSRELGHTDAETLIEAIRGRLREDLTMLIPAPEVRHSGR